MRALVVVKLEIVGQSLEQLDDALIVLQIDVLVLV
jgi:hypothetical protein